VSGQPEVLAVVPARGGSKGIPRKNLALCGGAPLIAYSIHAARRAKLVGRVIVSTEDEEIASVARNRGAEVPFLRPAELARDETPGIEPLLHCLDWLAAKEGYHPAYSIYLQPTSPFRLAADVDAAIELALQRDADAVVSVTEAKHSPYWIKVLDAEGRLRDSLPQSDAPARRQELPRLVALNGAIYLARTDVLLEKKTWYTERTHGYVMPAERSLDIDTPWDLSLANLILNQGLLRAES
jgi:N-acylneuraminate cytidylyltransferase/CMP-N,N'-diacetyllegionaminic acid synthase